jgi:hypothetical protein
MMNYNELNYRPASIIVLIEAVGRTWHEVRAPARRLWLERARPHRACQTQPSEGKHVGRLDRSIFSFYGERCQTGSKTQRKRLCTSI